MSLKCGNFQIEEVLENIFLKLFETTEKYINLNYLPPSRDEQGCTVTAPTCEAPSQQLCGPDFQDPYIQPPPRSQHPNSNSTHYQWYHDDKYFKLLKIYLNNKKCFIKFVGSRKLYRYSNQYCLILLNFKLCNYSSGGTPTKSMKLYIPMILYY